MADLDQGGSYFQKCRVYLGPTLGWTEVQVQPQLTITTGGATTLALGTSLVLVDAGANNVTINLPDVVQWMKILPFLPGNAFERAIWIKDYGGNADTNNITVHPFSGQKIDKLAIDFTILQKRQLLRLYPTNDLSGWFSG